VWSTTGPNALLGRHAASAEQDEQKMKCLTDRGRKKRGLLRANVFGADPKLGKKRNHKENDGRVQDRVVYNFL